MAGPDARAGTLSRVGHDGAEHAEHDQDDDDADAGQDQRARPTPASRITAAPYSATRYRNSLIAGDPIRSRAG